MRKILLILVICFTFNSCNRNLDKGQIVSAEDFAALNENPDNSDKRFAVVGYPFLEEDIQVRTGITGSSATNFLIYTEPEGKGKYIAILPIKYGEGKNNFHAPETFTISDIDFYDNDGNAIKGSEQMMFSFTLALQTNRPRMKMGDRMVYYGMPENVRIDKAP